MRDVDHGMGTKSDNYDYTSAQRASNHLKRLTSENGKRLPVDLSSAHLRQIGDLIAVGYGSSAAAVIRKAVEEAHASRVVSKGD